MLSKKTRHNLDKYQRRAAKKIKKYREEKKIMPEQEDKLKWAKKKMEEGKMHEKTGKTKEAYEYIKHMLESDELDQKKVEYDEDKVNDVWDAEIEKGIKRGHLKKANMDKDKLLRKLNNNDKTNPRQNPTKGNRKRKRN